MESTKKRPYPLFASVLFDLAIEKPLEYGIPQDLITSVEPGVQVASLRKKRVLGLVLDVKEESSFSGVKPIIEVVSKGPLLPPDLFELAQFASSYYLTPLSQVLKVMLPRQVRKEHLEKYPLIVRKLISMPATPRESDRAPREVPRSSWGARHSFAMQKRYPSFRAPRKSESNDQPSKDSC